MKVGFIFLFTFVFYKFLKKLKKLIKKIFKIQFKSRLFRVKKINTDHLKGMFAEKFCALYLFFIGFKIIKTNHKSRLGEIDIIALKNNTIWFFEVKKRSNLKSFEVVTLRQENRIKNSGCAFARTFNKFNNSNYLYQFKTIIVSSFFKKPTIIDFR